MSISKLKESLGGGLKKNKFLLEVAVPGIDSEKLNILCKTAGLPQRTIGVTEVWYKGRKYNIRSETDYGGEYEITVLDDSKMSLRKAFDKWMQQVDDSRKTKSPKTSETSAGLLSGSSYEESIKSGLGLVKSATSLAAKAKNIIENPKQVVGDYVMGKLNPSRESALAEYQTDFNIWQLDNAGKKVYGYKLQNAFPKNIGQVQFDSSSQNELTEFSITFAFSEFITLEDNLLKDVASGLFGEDAGDAVSSVESLFS
jgi:hypothetical protein